MGVTLHPSSLGSHRPFEPTTAMQGITHGFPAAKGTFLKQHLLQSASAASPCGPPFLPGAPSVGHRLGIPKGLRHKTGPPCRSAQPPRSRGSSPWQKKGLACLQLSSERFRPLHEPATLHSKSGFYTVWQVSCVRSAAFDSQLPHYRGQNWECAPHAISSI